MQILETYIWLEPFVGGWQFGEQGVLRALCDRFGISRGYEVGAGDGESLPVTLGFLDDLTLYEIDETRREKLQAKYPKAKVLGAFEEPDNGMARSCVVVDVDSCDLAIAESITTVRPKVLCVEHYDMEGPRVIGAAEDRAVPDWLIGVQTQGGFVLQQPWQVVRSSLEAKGYRLVCLTRVNGIYVDEVV
jgi:hypothetical protein